MNQTTKFAMLCMPSSPRTSLHICRNNMVSDRPFPMLGRPLHDGRKVKLMRVGLSACRRERARSLHNGMEARVDIPVEALVKLSRPRPSPSRSAPYPSLWSYRRLRPAATPNRQARPPIKQQHERVALLRGANTVAGTEIEPQLADPAANRMQATHQPPHLEAQSESRADSGFRVPVLYPAEPLAIFASHMYFHMTCCIP